MNKSSINSNSEKSARQQIVEWIYKFSDDLANLFGGLFVFLIGLIVFVIVVSATDFYPQPKNNNSVFWTIINNSLSSTILIVAALISALFSLWAMFHFARQLEKSNRGMEEEAVYRLNDYSLETLRTIGIGRDVLKSLKAQLEKSGGDIDMTLSPETPNSWLDNLKKDIGEARVEECQLTILRYTRRQKEKIIDIGAPINTQQKVIDV